MIIHVVQPGETAYSIAEYYGISIDWLIRENGVADPLRPVVGNTYVILFPEETYVIQEGDTLESIAQQFHITVMDLLRNNTYLADQGGLVPGETLVIRYENTKIGRIAVNGYAYSFINLTTLRKTLPFLTYLTIYSYEITPDGVLVDIEDTPIIQLAKQYGVAPLMLLRFDDMAFLDRQNFMFRILTDFQLQEKIINDVLAVIERKGYLGLTLDTPYIFPDYRENYVAFINTLANRLREKGLIVFDALSPSAFEIFTGVIYSEKEVIDISTMVDGTIILTYDLATTFGPSITAIDFHTKEELITTILPLVPPKELQLGISTIGYRWELPYVAGVSVGNAISNTGAVQVARDFNIEVQYDYLAEAAYFVYEESGREFLVRYLDARSMQAYLQLAYQNNMYGVAIWNIMEYLYDLWLLVNGQFDIIKVI